MAISVLTRTIICPNKVKYTWTGTPGDLFCNPIYPWWKITVGTQSTEFGQKVRCKVLPPGINSIILPDDWNSLADPGQAQLNWSPASRSLWLGCFNSDGTVKDSSLTIAEWNAGIAHDPNFNSVTIADLCSNSGDLVSWHEFHPLIGGTIVDLCPPQPACNIPAQITVQGLSNQEE